MILSEVQNNIGVVSLNRPEKRNAFNAELVEQLYQQVHSFNQNEDLRAILIRGNGEAFSAGADLSYIQQLRSNSLEENEVDSKKLALLFEEIYNSPKLTFSAVDGYALAGGCGLATVTDFCLASPKANFGYTEVKIGFIPAIVMVYLQKKVSGQDLNKLLLTGNIIDATEALRMNLVSKLISDQGFDMAVKDYILNFVSKVSGQAITLTKEMIRNISNMDREDALNYAAKQNAIARSTKDCITGIDAFINKTKINW